MIEPPAGGSEVRADSAFTSVRFAPLIMDGRFVI